LRNRALESQHFDLAHLHTYNPFTDWYALRQVHRRAPVIIQSVHNVRPHDAMFPRPIETELLRTGYNACDLLLVAHEDLKAKLVREFRIPGHRVRIVPLPVLSECFDGTSDRGARRGGTASGSVLFFGTLRANKGIPVLLDAIAALPASAALRFVFAGRGDADLEDRIREAARSDERITAEIGYVTDDRRRALYAEADVVVLPYTEFDAQSGVLQDAYAAGTPVIASDIGALGATVRADGTGWVVPAGDAAALGQTIVSSLESESERSARAQRARAIADERSPSAIADALHSIYDELLSARA
jgi:glycosyltransferase involved in cell wall biosynthesis